MRFFSKKEVLVVGKEEADPDWEGIDGLRYTEISEFSKKYQPPAHLKDVLHKTVKKNIIATSNSKGDNVKSETVNSEDAFKKVESKNVKLTNSNMNNTPEIKADAPKDVVKKELQNHEIETTNDDIHYESTDDEFSEHEDHNEEFSFENEEKPIERSVRYSQSAQLSHALY